MSILTRLRSLSRVRAHTHTHTDVRAHTQTHTQAPSLAHVRSLTRSLTLSLAHTQKPQVITSCVDGENSQRIEWQLSDGQLSFNALVDREKAAGVPVHSVVRLLNWKIIRYAE